jgi:hypothetical protein
VNAQRPYRPGSAWKRWAFTSKAAWQPEIPD